MLVDLALIAAPFLVLILITAAGVDLTDTELLNEYQELEKESRK